MQGKGAEIMGKDYVPSVVVDGYHGLTTVSLEAKHLADGKIFLTGQITEETANEFAMKFLYLKEKGDPITIYIDTPGGVVAAGLIIYDLIQASSDVEIHMVCIGSAFSMGALIFAGGQKGRRHILPHGKVMIHEPQIMQGFGGSATSIQSLSDSMMEAKKMLNGILEKHTGKKKREIEAATRGDSYMNAQESIAFGLCDDIVENI